MGAITKDIPLNMFLREIEKHPVLDKDQEYDLAVKYYENNDIDAANKLVVSNLRFVIKVATEYKSYGFPLMDLVQEGTLGLMQAVKKFNPYSGYRLITYAVWWIKARIHNYIMKFWSNVKIGTTQAQRKIFQKLGSAKRKLNIENEKLHKKDVDRIADHFGVKNRDVIEMEMRMSSRDFSLDSKVNNSEEESATYLDMMPGEEKNQEQIVEELETGAIQEENLNKGLKKLNDRERTIIEERFLSGKPKKLRELGDKFGVSKERIRQIEISALKKIKSEFNSGDKLAA